MRADAFWLLATRLIDRETNPEGIRSAISRSYYGALLTSLAFLAEMGITIPKSDNSHKRVLEIMSNTGDKEISKVARLLVTLRAARNSADYDMKDKKVEAADYAMLRIDEAGDVIAAINTCRTATGPGGRYETVKAATVKWANKVLRGV